MPRQLMVVMLVVWSVGCRLWTWCEIGCSILLRLMGGVGFLVGGPDPEIFLCLILFLSGMAGLMGVGRVVSCGCVLSLCVRFVEWDCLVEVLVEIVVVCCLGVRILFILVGSSFSNTWSRGSSSSEARSRFSFSSGSGPCPG